MDLYDDYGVSATDPFRIDDLLNFSNEEDLFFTTTDDRASTFPDTLCVPSDDVADLEWLSGFVDDSFSDLTEEHVNQTVTGKARRKRTRAAATATIHSSWSSSAEPSIPSTGRKSSSISPSSTVAIAGGQPEESSSGRKCTHCASEKTPQWRAGPEGPKTLCNACGVRYKSGRLVPEYRPAASPTFVLTEHSNSHRKVMELRRQKEVLKVS